MNLRAEMNESENEIYNAERKQRFEWMNRWDRANRREILKTD